MAKVAATDYYGKLHARSVDLIGDFAGQELFLVDGDSLLLHLFSDSDLDFANGLQLLHLVFKVETFLQNLLDRRANFNLVWFAENEHLCVPVTEQASANAHKYLFARKVVMSHLDHFLRQVESPTKVYKLDAPDSEAALRLYGATGAYFMMCHDGAGNDNPDDALYEKIKERKSHLRAMIRTFVDDGMSVALVNEVEFRDTKVTTQVVESVHLSSSKQKVRPGMAAGITPAIEEESTEKNVAGLSDSDKALLEKLSTIAKDNENDLQLTQRLFLLTRASIVLGEQSEEVKSLTSAALLHAILLQDLPLADRRLSDVAVGGSDEAFEAATHKLLEEVSNGLQSTNALEDLDCDVGDVIDGRLLHYAFNDHKSVRLTPNSKASYVALCKLVGVAPLEYSDAASSTNEKTNGKADSDDENAVLPFTNECFDPHLASVQLTVARKEQKESPVTTKIFQDLTHWHNARKALNKRAAQPVLEGKAARRNQFYLAEMATYAASLTNAIGKSLDPEIIAPDTSKKSEKVQQKQIEIRKKPESSKPGGKKDNAQPGKKPKMTPAQAQKLALFEKEAERKDAKQDQAQVKTFQAWKVTRGLLDSIKDGQKRYIAAEGYLSGLPAEKKDVVLAEVKLYGISSLLAAIAAKANKASPSDSMNVLALVVSKLREIAQIPDLTTAEAANALEIAKKINMPFTAAPGATTSRKLSFDINLPKDIPSIKQDWKEFQLMHGGPYMERSVDARDDERVPFKPDAWQRQVLDELDRDKSVFVVAPTSAGKTFISFYAMRKVLAAGDDSILVYLAPTKALVNQIAAEVQARFTKQYKFAGNSVWAIHTRDHRINNPSGCQILVTVPHVLQIMLLAPENAKTWAPRVKRIIFDEIHCIGQADDGLVWEQLLLLAPCPIIALSATVGNSEEFNSWMASTQQALGHEMVKIEHTTRYSDLRKFVYQPPKRFSFQGLPQPTSPVQMGIEDPAYFSFVHPVSSLVMRSRGMPEDLSLEPRDCMILFQAMKKVQTPEYPIGDDLGPGFLPATIVKPDVLKWETKLKVVLRKWLSESASPLEALVGELSHLSGHYERPDILISSPDDSPASGDASAKAITLPDLDNQDAVRLTTLPLLVSLEQQRALPAIVFNYDRAQCEDICNHLLKELKDAEDEWKKNPAWTKKLSAFEDWKKKKEAALKKAPKASKSKNDQDAGMSKADRAMMAGAEDISEFESFDPDAPLDAFSFADIKKVRGDELAQHTDKLQWRGVDQWLIDALTRGIGVHHAGMNRLYRQAVEVLFRKGFLRVVIATGTLALGINMPCKTVVFSGDSVFLTALNYRQAAGRAGRRGFDLLGNVVFHGLSLDKVHRLMSSRLPDLNGHFPVTTTLVLRLFSLLHNSDYAPYARQAVKALLSQPRIYLGATAFKQQVLHHLRFSIDYLRRQNLLASNGAPINFAGTVAHLYYTENSAFTFHVLLKNGYFHSLARTFKKNPDAAKETLMLVMSHIFGRIVCKISDREYKAKNLKMSSSTVFLPELPKEAKQLLVDHNTHTQQIFTTYVRTFVEQHLKDTDQQLPLSGLKFKGSKQPPSIASLPTPTVRSAFVALSGRGDDFTSIDDLCSTVRSGVFLEKAVVPQLDIFPDESGRRLNAYLYDYFRNSDVRALQEDNGIRRADVWFALNDFSLVLATLNASLSNYLRASAMSELEMLDIKGGGDVADIAKDDEAAPGQETAEETKERLARAKNMATQAKPKTKKKKVADSWDAEEVSSESEDDDDIQDGTTAAETYSDTASTATAGEDEMGLRGVLTMFKSLQEEFNVKFRAMWA